MKLYELQHKDGLDSVTLTERPDPTPGAGQILIKVKAWSLNYRDLLVAKGAYGAPPPLGRIPLSDGAGEVVALGAALTSFADSAWDARVSTDAPRTQCYGWQISEPNLIIFDML